MPSELVRVMALMVKSGVWFASWSRDMCPLENSVKGEEEKETSVSGMYGRSWT